MNSGALTQSSTFNLVLKFWRFLDFSDSVGLVSFSKAPEVIVWGKPALRFFVIFFLVEKEVEINGI